MPQRGKTKKILDTVDSIVAVLCFAINFQINKISLIQGKMLQMFDPQFVEIQGPVDSNISKRQND